MPGLVDTKPIRRTSQHLPTEVLVTHLSAENTKTEAKMTKVSNDAHAGSRGHPSIGTAWKKKARPLFFILPTLIVLVVVSIFPLIYALRVSFIRFNLLMPHLTGFIGFSNYINAVTNDVFPFALKNTAIMMSISVVQFLFGFGVALLLNAEVRGTQIFRTIVIPPMLVAPIVVGLMWRYMYSAEMGIINYIVSTLGISPPDWLGSPRFALVSIVIADTWQWTPFMILVLLAGLQSIPVEPQEAAMIDGASAFQRIIHVTLPMLKPVILVVFLIRIMDLLKIFDKIWIMTRGGPGAYSEVLSLFAYRMVFKFYDVGQGSAVSLLILIIVIVISTGLARVLKEAR